MYLQWQRERGEICLRHTNQVFSAHMCCFKADWRPTWKTVSPSFRAQMQIVQMQHMSIQQMKTCRLWKKVDWNFVPFAEADCFEHFLLFFYNQVIANMCFCKFEKQNPEFLLSKTRQLSGFDGRKSSLKLNFNHIQRKLEKTRKKYELFFFFLLSCDYGGISVNDRGPRRK